MEGEIIFNIDVMLAKRKMSLTELAERVGITLANMSILKTGKAKAVKVTTLSFALWSAASVEAPFDLQDRIAKGQASRTKREKRFRFFI